MPPPCDRITDGPLKGAWLCSRERRRGPRCTYCNRTSTRLCDFPNGQLRMVGAEPSEKDTCSAPLCDRCTWCPAPEVDLCRAHAPLWDPVANGPRAGYGPETA